MRSPVDILGRVQQAVWRRNAEQPRAGYHEYIAVSADPQGVSVDFWGKVHEESYAELVQALTTPVAPSDHNRTIVGGEYAEDGVLARLLAAAPALRSLVSPSAPNADFFAVGRTSAYVARAR